VIRNGLAHVLSAEVGVVVISTVETITAVPRNDPPDVIVVDVPPRHGADGTSFWSLGPDHSRIVALCSPEDLPHLPTALSGGVRALITRDTSIDAVLVAVSTVVAGGIYIGPELAPPVIDQLGRNAGSRQRLPEREAETLRLLTLGLTHGQIGHRMGLTEATISTYVKRIRSKLNAGNKAELTRRAIELGYVGGRSAGPNVPRP
jgi:two-component system invasion response regulator UvrY